MPKEERCNEQAESSGGRPSKVPPKRRRLRPSSPCCRLPSALVRDRLMLNPLAIAIVSGLVFQLPLVLVVLVSSRFLDIDHPAHRGTSQRPPSWRLAAGDKIFICGSPLFNLVQIRCSLNPVGGNGDSRHASGRATACRSQAAR